jgi:hypothetical protein
MNIAELTAHWIEPEHYPAWRKLLEDERRVGNLTPARRDVLRGLLAFFGVEGLWPSDQTVADLTGYSRSTVWRARRDAKDLGLLRWSPRRNPSGRQGSNAYEVILRETPAARGVFPECQGERQRKEVSKKKGLTGAVCPSLRAGLPGVSLAERSKLAESRFNSAWLSRKTGGSFGANQGEPHAWTTKPPSSSPTSMR